MELSIHWLSRTNGCRKMSRIEKLKRRQTVTELSTEGNADPSRIVSEHTVQRI